MDEKLNGRGPPEILSVWSMWVRPGTWGSDHMLNRIFGSPVLASGGRSSDPSWPADKRRAAGHNWDGGVFFSLPVKSPVLNRVWQAELSFPHRFWAWGTTGVRVQQHFDAGFEKRRAQCPHNLPTALSPTVPLNLPQGQTTDPGMTRGERRYGRERERKQRSRWAGREHRQDRQRCKRDKSHKK